MSGVFRAIGKAFKAVGKVIKKIALPVLAIGATILTGGAAGIGLSSILGGGAAGGSALGGVAGSALTGAAQAAITGGNPLKGALFGGLSGALGGNGLGAAQAGSSQSASQFGGAAKDISDVAPAPVRQVMLPSTGASIELPGHEIAAPVQSAAAPAIQTGLGAAQAQGGAPAGGGLLSFLNNPVITGSLIQGIGSGIAAKAANKAQREQDEREVSRFDETGGLFSYGGSQGSGSSESGDEDVSRLAYSNMKLVQNKKSGRVRLVHGG